MLSEMSQMVKDKNLMASLMWDIKQINKQNISKLIDTDNRIVSYQRDRGEGRTKRVKGSNIWCWNKTRFLVVSTR